MVDIDLWLDRILALFLVPVLLIVGMAFVVAAHDWMEAALQGMTGDFFGMDFLVTIISVGLFVALCFGAYKFVEYGGPWILR